MRSIWQKNIAKYFTEFEQDTDETYENLSSLYG